MANKRVVDGPGIWRSTKLKQVQPVAFRAEFANLLPLATANGTFECSPDLILHQVYGFNRPDMTLELVTQLLDEYERVKLLFRWMNEDDSKVYGYWVGIDKAGRLPPESRRGHEVVGPDVPKQSLNDFIHGKIMANHWLTTGSLGFGSGLGSCIGEGEGEGGETAPEHEPQRQIPPSPFYSDSDRTFGQVEGEALWIEEQAADPPGDGQVAVLSPQLSKLIRSDLQAGRTRTQILSAIRQTISLDGYASDKKPGLFLFQNYPAQLRVVADKRPMDARKTQEMIVRITEREKKKAAEADARYLAKLAAEAAEQDLVEDFLPDETHLWAKNEVEQ